MRWLSFVILIGVVLTLQTTLAPRMAVASARPDWAVVVVVMLAMHARAADALIAATLIGLAADLASIERLGVHAAPYTVVAWLVVSVREALFRREAVTQCLVTWAAACCVQVCWLFYRAVGGAGLGGGWVDACGVAVLAAAYTALWAPLFHSAALSAGALLGLPGRASGEGRHTG